MAGGQLLGDGRLPRARAPEHQRDHRAGHPRAEGGVDGAGDRGPVFRARAAEGLRRAGRRAQDRHRVRRGPGPGHPAVEQRLHLGLGDGAQQVGQRGIGVADGHEGHDVDRARHAVEVALLRGRSGPHGPAEADGGLDPHAAVLGGGHGPDRGGGQHPDAGTREAERVGDLGQMGGDVGAAVVRRHLHVEHPLAQPDAAAHRAPSTRPAAVHRAARPGRPARAQPSKVRSSEAGALNTRCPSWRGCPARRRA